MCGRFWIAREGDEDWTRIMAELNRKPSRQAVKSTGDIFPGDFVPVLATSRAGIPSVFAMKWGLPVQKRLLINVRSETADEKPVFQESASCRRCLIPASGYYEWQQTETEKRCFGVDRPGHNPLYLAGLYFLREGLPVFAVLTREAVEESAKIHHRMPVLMEKRQMRAWLRPAGSVSTQLPPPHTDLRIRPMDS